MYRLVTGLVLSLLAVAGQAAVQSGVGPTERVRAGTNAVFMVLKNDSLDSEQKWEKIAAVLYDGFDFRSMSQSILAANWQKASPEEKLKFVEYFSQYLEQVYREKIEQYTNQTVEYVSETVTDHRAVVDTVIVTSGTRIPVTYKMRDNEGEWMVYDVVIEGVSLVSNYRATYAEIVQTDGMEGLLLDIRDQIEASRAEYVLQRQADESTN